jgi:hypothetical protein
MGDLVAIGLPVVCIAAERAPTDAPIRLPPIGIHIHRLPAYGSRCAAVVGVQVDWLPVKHACGVAPVGIGCAARARACAVVAVDILSVDGSRKRQCSSGEEREELHDC